MLIKLEKLIKRHRLSIKGILHIGASTGQEIPLYERLNIKNLVLFEPCTDAFTELYNNYGGKYPLYNIALSDYEGESEMFTTQVNGGQSNSLLRPTLHEKYYPDIVFDQKETVAVRKLDSLSFDRTLYNTIVIDVQGAELPALKGGLDTLKHIDYIISEVNKESLYENCTLVEELDLFLINFRRVETKWTRNGWGDALYIRKTLL